MTKEDVERDEVFWNTTLAPDDITRLFEPKALTGFERWDADAIAARKPRPVDRIDPDKDNLLIKGNNLLALHTLKQRYAGQVKLIYIDPPFNTGTDSFRYNDRFNHSSWLTFFANRLSVGKKLLKSDGVIAVQLDDREQAYAKVLMDEMFGRENYVNCVAVKTNSPFGFKGTSEGLFKQASFLLIYAKDKTRLEVGKTFVRRDYDTQYRFVFDDVSLPEEEWTWTGIREAVAEELGFGSAAAAVKAMSSAEFDAKVPEFAIENAHRVFRTASVTGGALKKRKATIERSKAHKNAIIRHPGDDMDYRFIGGERVLLYQERIVELDGERFPGELVTDIWTDIAIEGIAGEGGVEFPKGKKPEALLRRIIELFTKDGETVLDYFAGSGTAAAVAHKLGRHWITIEQLDYTGDLPVQRLKNVVKGDATGVSVSVDWQGGGSFVYLELAEANETFASRVRSAADDAALERMAAELREKGWWRYKVDQSLWDWEEWAALALRERKQLLLESIDANHLYVNYRDIDDADTGLSADDIAATKAFYEGGA